MDDIRQMAPVQEPGSQPVTDAKPPKPPKAKKGFLRGKLIWVVVILVVAASAGAVYYFMQRNNDLKADLQAKEQQLSNPEEVAKQQNEALISEVGAIVDLPEGETPTVATVSDVSKLEGQAFFVDAENGDKVLIYTEAKKAYLYRPSTKKVINIAPVNIGDSQQQ